MKYCYVKKIQPSKSRRLIMFSVVSLMFGTLTLLWSFYPIVAYQLAQLVSFNKQISPLPNSVLASSLQKGLSVYNEGLKPYYSSYLKDFTRVGEWFPQRPQTITHHSSVEKYTLSVPSLGISKAEVVVGGEDLAQSLVQYGDQTLPGQIGNSVILGHSTLPQLYKEKDYKSIFTYLSSLEQGDVIRAHINGFTYEYVVYDMFIVDPDETWVLDPKADESILTLISCVPPGTYWQRLVVKAKLTRL